VSGVPGGRRTEQRTAIESIEQATAEARAGGHTLAGFVRRCNSAGYGFFARCRVCRMEVAVHRDPSGWGHSLERAECTGDRNGARSPSGNGHLSSGR
jgi:hypothetical protein